MVGRKKGTGRQSGKGGRTALWKWPSWNTVDSISCCMSTCNISRDSISCCMMALISPNIWLMRNLSVKRHWTWKNPFFIQIFTYQMYCIYHHQMNQDLVLTSKNLKLIFIHRYSSISPYPCSFQNTYLDEIWTENKSWISLFYIIYLFHWNILFLPSGWSINIVTNNSRNFREICTV